LLLLGSFYGFSSVVSLNWVATPYLFPVIYASSTQGLCNVLARLATILAPQLAELPQPIPMIIVTCLGLLAGFSVIFLKPLANAPKDGGH
jgi:hypothetical protein